MVPEFNRRAGYSGTVITIHCPPITIHLIFHSQLLNVDSRFRGKDGEGKMLKLPANRQPPTANRQPIKPLKTHTIIILLLLLVSGCSASQPLLDAVLNSSNNNAPVTQQEAAQGLKEALLKGATQGAESLAKPDAFFGNETLRILVPPEAQIVEKRLRQLGLNQPVDRVIASLNKAAEQAVGEAVPVFKDAIMGLSFQDAFAIVTGEPTAATEFLRQNTYQSLTQRFKPQIQASLDKVDATRYWADLMSRYNQIPLVQPIETDLAAYVTQKTIDGLFLQVAQEESALRENPMQRTSTLLKRVFALQD